MQRHEEGGREGDDEDDGDDEQHGGRLQVGHAHLLLRLFQYRPLDLAVRHAAVRLAAALARFARPVARVLHFAEQHVLRVAVLLRRVALRHLDQVQTLVLLFLALRATEQHRLIDHDVQHDDDDETHEVHARVELLVVPLEVAAEHQFVGDAMSGEHDEHLRRQRLRVRRRGRRDVGVSVARRQEQALVVRRRRPREVEQLQP